MTYQQMLSALKPDDIISLRTLQRDLTALEMAGFPLQSELRDKEVFWWLSLPHGLLFPMELSELIALYSATLAARVQGLPEAGGLSAIASKLSAGLPGKTRKFFEVAQRALMFIGPRQLAAAAKIGRLSERITRCAVESKTVEMLYDSLNSGRRAWRRVDPYAVVLTPSASYLLGYCQRSKEFRVFHLGRIQDLRESDQPFVRTDISVEQFFRDSFEIWHGKPEPVSIRFTGKSAVLASERCWHDSQTLKKVTQGVQLELFVHPGKDLQRWILGFGGEAEVLEPELLRRQISEEHGRAAESYAVRRPQKKPPLSVTEPKSAKTGETG
ncbi:MAG: helix-turn-helix transcriptional regulator [Acidobacteriota bacterium]